MAMRSSSQNRVAKKKSSIRLQVWYDDGDRSRTPYQICLLGPNSMIVPELIKSRSSQGSGQGTCADPPARPKVEGPGLKFAGVKLRLYLDDRET